MSEDGGAGIRDITEPDDNKYQFIITTNTDKLNIVNSYYISYADKEWAINKITSTFSGYPNDYSKKYVCQFDGVGLDLSSDDIMDRLPNINLSEEFIISNCKLDYFIESSLEKYIDRFDEGNVDIVNGIDRYKKLLMLYPYSERNKKDYSIIIDRLSSLGLLDEKKYVESKTIKKYATMGTIIDKSHLYSPIDKKSNMYLIKGDKVHILNESVDKNNQKWYFINYKGKKDINMWIKAEVVDID
ncbi:hypothetical protein [Actinobacillus equuli]|uniref:hypothetical protein n=1 Tax=Actinobacillus equuli TaxID=718 RepID=UPI002441A68A|nr:hypothetical protein [Actinobacillus equuli]WGE43074.1 hypothetical protein NYR64_04330 [Actinobacillus equuli subsp. haemolyticus]